MKLLDLRYITIFSRAFSVILIFFFVQSMLSERLAKDRTLRKKRVKKPKVHKLSTECERSETEEDDEEDMHDEKDSDSTLLASADAETAEAILVNITHSPFQNKCPVYSFFFRRWTIGLLQTSNKYCRNLTFLYCANKNCSMLPC